jgi:hypothetical protein
MSLLPVSEVCLRRIWLAAAANPTLCTMVAVRVISVPAHVEITSSTASTVPSIHAKAIEHGKGWQDSSLTFMKLWPAWRLSNATVPTIGWIRKENDGHALPAAHPSHGMRRCVPRVVVALCRKRTNCQAGENSCAASCSRWCTERERRKTGVFNKPMTQMG